MPTYSRPNYSTGVWSSEGTMYTPTSEKINLGHVVEKPPFEIVNYIENRQDSAIAYLLQVGIADWDQNTTYTTNAYTSFNGDVYQAQSQNSDKQPSTNPSIWKIKWAKSDDFESLKAIVNSIRNSDGYLTHYVSKNSPTMYNKCLGTSYLANTGLNSSGSLNVGYGFNGKTSDGLYHNGTNPVIQKNGAVIAVFNPDVDITKSSTDVVTMKDLQRYMQQYRVGDLYLTTNPTDPATTFGYGTWERYAEGRALVGVASPTGSTPEWTKYSGSNFGSYTHTLSVGEIPPHSHENNIPTYGESGAPNNMIANGQKQDNTRAVWSTSDTGGGQAHNNVQPSITVFIWRRTA